MKKRFGKWTFAALCALMLFLAGIPTAAAQSEMPQVILTFDKESVNVGEEVTASYEVVGGSGNYRNFHFDISAITRGEQDYALSHIIAYVDYDTRSGKLTAVPKFGYTVLASLGFEDENGQNFYYESEKISVLGDTTVFPTVTITFDKDNVNVGEEVTASYEVVGGSGNYRNFHFDISAITRGEQDYALSHIIAYANYDTRSGKLTAVPKFGYTVLASLGFEDENGQNFYYESEKISVLGDTTVFPTVTITFDKDNVNVGEEVTASYEVVGGSGNYRNFHFDISAITRGEQDYALSHIIAYADYNTRSGKLTAVPKFGYTVMVSLGFEDENGQNFYYESEKLPISGTTGTVNDYEVIEGGGNAAYTGSGALTFRINADFEKFRALLVDDRLVSESGYTAWSGSTYVSLKESYLDTLSEGTHTLSALFSDGYAETTFIVGPSAAATPPRTGDTAMPYLWLTACLLAGAGFFCGLRRAKKHS